MIMYIHFTIGDNRGMQMIWWFATVCTPGADKVVGLQTEMEDLLEKRRARA